MSAEFFFTSLIVIIMPGTGVIYTLAVGLGRGFRASIAAALGCTFGIVPAAFASIAGLAAIFHTSALAFQFVKFLGVAYLLYMAWRLLSEQTTFDVGEEREPASLARTALNGMLLNVLNPKLSLFFLAFLPQFVEATDRQAAITMSLLAAFFMALTFIVFVLYGWCASLAHDYVISRPVIMTWLKRSFAAAFGFLGVRLALADR